VLGAAAKERMLAAFAPLAPAMRALVAATNPAVVVEHGLYIRPAERMTESAFGAGRVAIVGDAAHPVRPTGQGFNLAAEDAYFLAAKLAEAADAAAGVSGGGKGGGRGWLDGADVRGALDAFRAVRLPRVKAIMADAQERGARAYKREGGGQQQQQAYGKQEEQEQPKEDPQKQKQLQDWQKDWAEFVFGIKLAPLGAEVVARA
jgi:2-polyprenyl-6-methoxyphenol hydroxylase-like FAD-dependent oxidoreductase